MTRGPASNLPGMPSGATDFNSRMSATALLGIRAGTGSGAAGAALPPTTAGAGDAVSVPWHPDSPVFWLLLLTGATVLGITGASVKVRAFKARAGAGIGTA